MRNSKQASSWLSLRLTLEEQETLITLRAAREIETRTRLSAAAFIRALIQAGFEDLQKGVLKLPPNKTVLPIERKIVGIASSNKHIAMPMSPEELGMLRELRVNPATGQDLPYGSADIVRELLALESRKAMTHAAPAIKTKA